MKFRRREKQVGVRLRSDQHAALKEIAESKGYDSVSEYIRALLEKAPGVVLMDRREPGGYPTPVGDAAGQDPVYVGRLREDISHPRGLNLWVVSDNIRKGAALNAVQVGELLVKSYL